MTLTVGIDTYCTLAEANAYFADTLNSATWLAISETNREICLKMACRKMETLKYTGYKQVEAQVLEFPRYYENKLTPPNLDIDDDFSGIYDGTPQSVKNAQSELALYLYQNQNNKVLTAQQMGLKSISLGNESYSFSDGVNLSGVLMSVEASEYLDKWLRKGFKVG